jgi:2-polyprenyl-3-methyl-5-hydroxy-6-metoxy-1,4-benzoquinol methylase
MSTDSESSETLYECEVCGRRETKKAFVLPVLDGPYEAETGRPKRSFYQCDNCGYLFVRPLDSERYARYYANLDGSYHQQHDYENSRYPLVLRAVQPLHVRRILDWGCGRGTFLDNFTHDVEKYGIELSSAAADCARRSNIQILSAEEIARGVLDQSLDAVTAIDVVEHITNLTNFRSSVARVLRPGGTFAVLTGNLDSPAAKLLGRYWYYIHYGEHVSFLTERAARDWLRTQFEDIRISRVTHHRSALLSLLRAYSSFPVASILEKVGLAKSLRISAKLHVDSDHMLILARRRTG